MDNNLKIKKLQLVNMMIYFIVLVLIVLMWVFGLKVNTSNPDGSNSFGESLGSAAAAIIYIVMKMFAGAFSSFFCVLPLIISLVNVIGKNQALTRYYVTFIVFSAIQIITVSSFGLIIIASKNLVGYLFIAIVLLDIVSIIINAILISIKRKANI